MSQKNKKGIENKLWQWKGMEYLSYLLVFLTPLSFSSPSNWYPFGPIKIALVISLTLLMLILYGWGLLVKRDWNFRLTPVHIVTLVFLSILTLSSIFGVDPVNSFFGRWKENISLVLIYALAIFAFLVGFLVKKNKDYLYKLLLASFISSIGVALVSYTGSSWFSIFREGASTIGNSSHTGAYLLFNVCFGVGLFFCYSKAWQKVLIFLGGLVLLFSPILFNQDILLGKIRLGEVAHKPFLLLGYANGAVLGLIVSILIIISFFLIYSSKKVVKIIGLGLFIVLLSSIFYIGILFMNPTSAIHTTYMEQKGGNRFIAWDEAASGLETSPILGNGYNNFSYTFQKYFNTDIFKSENSEIYFLQPHNVIWEYASNNGVLGLVSFLALLFFIFLALFQMKDQSTINFTIWQREEITKDKIIRIVLIGILFGYFIQNLFVFDSPVTYLMLFLLLGIATGMCQKEWYYLVDLSRNFILKIKGWLIIIFCLIAFYLFVILPQIEINRIEEIKSTSSIKKVIELRKNIQEVSLLGGAKDISYVAGEFYSSYSKNINQINKSNRDLYLEDIQFIIDELDRSIKKQPQEIQPYIVKSHLINLGVFIEGRVDEGKYMESYNSAKMALDLNSYNPEIYILLAQTSILKEDFASAYISMRQAIALAPMYKKSYDYARKLLKIKPDKDFQKYVDEMEANWANFFTN